MTKDKAISILDELWKYEHTDKYTDKEIKIAIDMAIEVLEQEPCKDCISRVDLLSELAFIQNRPIHTAMKIINQMRSVKQESNIGRWNIVSDGYGESAYICECSECKNTVWVYKDKEREWKYCPNCGCKMKSEDDMSNCIYDVLEECKNIDCVACVLDKIKTELEELKEWHDSPIEYDGGNDFRYCEAIDRCLRIIDKYR